MRIKSILKIDTKNKKLSDKIINNVDEILKIKNINSNADVSEIEREIDGMVWLKPAVGVGFMV